MNVTLEQLLSVMPRLPIRRGGTLLPELNRALQEFDINTPVRVAAFLAQLAHESAELRFFEELASGAAYEGRKDLGNVLRGDGERYKGRGPIQLTGRAGYARAGKALGIDLVGDPKRAADADVGFRVAGWYWASHGLSALADVGDFDRITRRINGGINGKAHRDAYHARARAVFGVL